MTEQASETFKPPPPPQLSPDGQWWWTGAEWVPEAQRHTPTAPSVLPASRPSTRQEADTHEIKRLLTFVVAVALVVLAIVLIVHIVHAENRINNATGGMAHHSMLHVTRGSHSKPSL